MSDALNERLNKILPRVVSDDFLSGSGIGNEIAFYIFDYPPEDELRVRDYLRILAGPHPEAEAGLRVKHVNLFDFVLDYLKSAEPARQGAPDAAGQGRRGAEEGPRRPAARDKMAGYFAEVARPEQHDLVLVSGVGSVWPLLRSHAC